MVQEINKKQKRVTSTRRKNMKYWIKEDTSEQESDMRQNNEPYYLSKNIAKKLRKKCKMFQPVLGA